MQHHSDVVYRNDFQYCGIKGISTAVTKQKLTDMDGHASQ